MFLRLESCDSCVNLTNILACHKIQFGLGGVGFYPNILGTQSKGSKVTDTAKNMYPHKRDGCLIAHVACFYQVLYKTLKPPAGPGAKQSKGLRFEPIFFLTKKTHFFELITSGIADSKL